MFDKPPFLDWSLDRWKVVVIFLLFVVLLFLSLFQMSAPVTPALRSQPAQRVVEAATESNAVAASESAAQAAPAEVAAPATLSAPVAATVPAGGENRGLELSERRTGIATTDPIFPLTLAGLAANAVVPQAMVATLEGTAAPGHRVEVRSRMVARPGSAGALATPVSERFVGAAEVATDGRWRVSVNDPFEPGQHELTLVELDSTGAVVTTSAPTLITILSAGEEGPLSLATPSIRFPSVGARLRSGRITFVGSGLPGMRVQLYLGSEMLGETSVNSREEWRLTPETDILPGIYVARVTALGPDGAVVAESPPVAFAVYDAPLGLIPPYVPSEEWRPLEITTVQVAETGIYPLLVRGYATPQREVMLWFEGRALAYVNAAADGGWSLWVHKDVMRKLPPDLGWLTFRSDLGEITTAVIPQVEAAETEVPTLLMPQPGDVLATSRPVIAGTAKPLSEVSVIINGATVAVVRADGNGHWAYQVLEPLPPGKLRLTARASGGGKGGSKRAAPIVVTVSPQL